MLCPLYAVYGLFLPILCVAQQKNVCKTFPDYYKNMQENENCYYNPDSDLTLPQIIQRHGYAVEEHYVTTEDGYILTVFRIPNSNRSNDVTQRPPVFLQHGIGLNCASFVVRASKSLAFILSDAGYDVWLGNFRGTLYSRQHTNLNNATRQYWDYSLHEMGVYDLPAQLNLVWDTTKQKITYIGFSMGSTCAYIYSITYPDVAFDRIRTIISLAPIAFLKDINSIVKYITPLWKYIERGIDALTNGHVALRDSSRVKSVCSPFPFQMKLCEFIPNVLFGFNYEEDDPETLPISQMHNRDDTSLKTLNHYIQLIESDKFQYYDYGLPGNLLKYGSPVPPSYNLSKIRVPQLLVRGDNDLMATKENVERLHANLPQHVKRDPIRVVKYKKFAHTGFILAKHVVELVYADVVIYINSLK